MEWQGVRRVEGRISGFVRLCTVEIAFGVVAVLLTSEYLANGPRIAEFLIPAILLHIAAILTIASPAWQIATLKATDYSQPIVNIQQRLARIKVSRTRFTQAILLSSPMLWSLFTMIALDALSGFKVHQSFGAPCVVANLLFGVAAVPLLYWLAPAMGRRFLGSAAMTSLMDDLGGRNLSAALRDLEEISRFRKEE